MQINRNYFKQSNTVYVFPVGFIQSNEVFDKEFISENWSWYDILIKLNRVKPVGIANYGNDAGRYQYYHSYEIPSTAVYINDSSVLGGL